MITFFHSSSHRAATDAIYRCLQQDVTVGRHAILLVPEHLSHESERLLCLNCGNQSSRWAEVLSFSRLADRISSLEGDADLHAIDQGGRVLLMYRAVQDLRSNLKHFHPAKIRMEFLLQLLELSAELDRCAITPEQLSHASEQVDGYLAEKLTELSMILHQYAAIVAVDAIDPMQKLTRLARLLPDTEVLSDFSVYLDGFSCFSAQEREVVEQLGLCAHNLTISLADGTADVFSPARQTARALQRYFVSQNATVVHQEIPAPMNSALDYLREQIFLDILTPYPATAPEVSLGTAQTIYEECILAASRIAEEVRRGRRYREIQLACTDIDRYRPQLESVFARFGIPLALRRSEPILAKPLIEAILAALDCVVYKFERDDVLRYLKSGYAPVEQTLIDRMENYALMWNLHGRQWKTPWLRNPDGFGSAMDEKAASALEQLNLGRSACMAPLEQLQASLEQARHAEEMVRALYAFCEQTAIPEQLQAHVDQLSRLGRQTAMEDVQLYEIFLTALEQIYAVLGTEPVTLENFAELVRLVLSQYQVGTIPPSSDCVAVGALNMMRQRTPAVLLILGAQEGLFPRYRSGDGILTDNERERLHRCGLTNFRCHADDTEAELLAIYHLLAAPTEQLQITCCTGTDEPSHLFQRIAALFPNSGAPHSGAVAPILYSAASSAGMLMAMAKTQPAYRDIAACIHSLQDAPAEEAAKRYCDAAANHAEALSQNMVQQLYGRTLYLSASRIDQFAACHCGYFYRYGLKAKPRRPAKFDAPIYGTFVHAVLEHTVQQIMDEGGFRQVDQAQAMKLTEQAIARFVAENPDDWAAQSERMQYLFNRNRTEVRGVVTQLWEEMRHSEFLPVQYELEFSDQGAMPAVLVKGNHANAEISGFVDRVDCYKQDEKTYLRVIDYKTGPKAFDYTDILEGIGLQMLIYLFALEDHGAVIFGTKPTPAGVLYVPAHDQTITVAGHLSPEEAKHEKESGVKRSGLILNEGTMLEAMESPALQSKFLPITLKSTGAVVGDLASMHQLQLLKDYVHRLLVQMTDEIASGDVRPTPYVRDSQHGSCRYCDYAAACHFDAAKVKMRVLKRTPREQFWGKLEQEAQHG